MLTGKELFEAFDRKNRALSWEDIPSSVQKMYNGVADKLSEKHITPLQGGLVEAYKALNKASIHNCEIAEQQIAGLEQENASLKNVGSMMGKRMEVMGKKLTFLRKLIEKYSDLAEAYQNLTDNADDIIDSEWHEEKQALDARALALLREEPHHV